MDVAHPIIVNAIHEFEVRRRWNFMMFAQHDPQFFHCCKTLCPRNSLFSLFPSSSTLSFPFQLLPSNSSHEQCILLFLCTLVLLRLYSPVFPSSFLSFFFLLCVLFLFFSIWTSHLHSNFSFAINNYDRGRTMDIKFLVDFLELLCQDLTFE